MQTILLFFNMVIAVLGGVYLFINAVRIHDNVQKANYFILGVVGLYYGLVYLSYYAGNIDINGLSMYLRPANGLLLLIPSLITWRMKR